jgi:hypothetical protein
LVKRWLPTAKALSFSLFIYVDQFDGQSDATASPRMFRHDRVSSPMPTPIVATNYQLIVGFLGQTAAT